MGLWSKRPEESRLLSEAALKAERQKLPSGYMANWSDDDVVSSAERGNPEAVLERDSRTKRMLFRAGDTVGIAKQEERKKADEMNRRVLEKLRKHLTE
jgi:hypothetical protein